MSYKKYLDDYRIEEYIDKHGRVKTGAAYNGDYYAVSPGISGKDIKILIIASAAALAAYIAALAQITETARKVYILLPFAASVFPLILTTIANISLYHIKERMTREQADKTAGRLPVTSLLATILSGISFTGFIVTALLSQQILPAGDMFFGIYSFITALMAVLIYIRCRKVKPILCTVPVRIESE